jgi:diaminopimelate decarboxylase
VPTTTQTLSQVYPIGSRVNEQGHLEIGGCDAVELAREFGTPAYVVAEDDLRQRARAFVDALASRHEDFDVLFASKAFPCTAVYRALKEEGLSCDVASGGELALALKAGFDPRRIYLHGNARSVDELRDALEAGIGHIVLDSLDDFDRLERICADMDRRQEVLIRVTPGIAGDTHHAISTGQADSKFGFGMGEAGAAIERIEAIDGLLMRGVHAHVGSQLLELEPFRQAAAALARIGDYPVWNLGGGLGVAYTEREPGPPEIEEYVLTIVQAAREHGMGPDGCLLIEPGRALVANSCVTLYTVESVKHNASTWVAVDGGMSDNLRPMLYGAAYEAQVADRFGGEMRCALAGKHCESGDVIVRDLLLDDPKPGDVIVTPVTGGYGYAMSNNYNGVTRAPVIFCKDGEAREVVRRESFDDLTARDVL